MADNLTQNQVTIGYDDVSSVLIQRVKPTFGADGSATDWNPDLGAGNAGSQTPRVMLATDQTELTNVLGKVSKPTFVVSVTPTIDTNIYAAGDAVGAQQDLANAARTSGGYCDIDNITIIDKGNQKPNLTLLFFDATLSAATVTNNAAFVFSTDVSKLIGKCNVVTADFETVNSIAVAQLRNLSLRLKSAATSIYVAVVITSGTPTFLSSSDLIFRYGITRW
ncbi:hypothetical protein EBZ38_08915 [bacterium]|nr:hypothetical protein [bacterium]NDD84375.1 hypothetical protein [bacterium]NDG19015.1 hypothetical protein [Betaproteobacteria bacterium]